MPANFKFYNPENIVGWPEKLPKPDLWKPWPTDNYQNRWDPTFLVLGRLRAGATLAQGLASKFKRAPLVALGPETKILVHECRIPGTGVHNSTDE